MILDFNSDELYYTFVGMLVLNILIALCASWTVQASKVERGAIASVPHIWNGKNTPSLPGPTVSGSGLKGALAEKVG